MWSFIRNYGNARLTGYTSGGRTAWSSTVFVSGKTVSARYWYDGQYVNNAKEDAAEVALQHLQNADSPTTSPPRMRNFSVYGGAQYTNSA